MNTERNGSDSHAFWDVLLRRLGRSLAVYVVSARPWVPHRREEVWEALEEIATQHADWADRVAELITGRGYLPNMGAFPLSYTRFHDVGIDFIVPRILEDLRGVADFVKKESARRSLSEEEKELLAEIENGLRRQITTLESSLPHPDANGLKAQASS